MIQNVQMGKSEKEMKTAEFAHTGTDSTGLQWNLSVFLLQVKNTEVI